MTVQELISKYDAENFDALKNKAVEFRSKGNHRNSLIYMVYLYNVDSFPFAVEISNNDFNVLDVKYLGDSCLDKKKVRDTIEATMKEYKKYKFCVLSVDRGGNVFINPYKQEFPCVVRKAPNSNPEKLKFYKQYKGNWYVAK